MVSPVLSWLRYVFGIRRLYTGVTQYYIRSTSRHLLVSITEAALSRITPSTATPTQVIPVKVAVSAEVYDSIISSGTHLGKGRPLYCRRPWESDHT